ncbi:MAG TPA: FkbM family methyltransferase [Flavisolibacter sp.]|nr:FkbM family methyltransferase [Flavisolibacter sp.]
MSRFTNLKASLSFREALKIYFRLKTRNRNNIRISRLRHPFSMRNNIYDYGTFQEVIVKEAYNIALDFNPKYIVDGGGNIGLTAAYFATKFPDATIISFEPDKENFELLKQNTVSYKNVKPVNAGLWNRPAHFTVKDGGLGNNAFTVEEVEQHIPGAVRAWSIADIMHEMNWPHIDLLKLDVEGSEKEIFSNAYESWLPKTRILIVELHDRIKNGCSKAVFSAVSKYDFSFEIAGENLVFINQNKIIWRGCGYNGSNAHE